MREIKFRAIPFEWNQFIYGSYVGYKDTHYIYAEMYERATHIGILSQVQIDKSTLGQYTGLKDKNGKEIYEGDIIKHHFNSDNQYSLEKVVFGRSYNEMGELRESVGFHRVSLNSDTIECPTSMTYGLANYEIIGNIHENPELLHST